MADPTFPCSVFLIDADLAAAEKHALGLVEAGYQAQLSPSVAAVLDRIEQERPEHLIAVVNLAAPDAREPDAVARLARSLADREEASDLTAAGGLVLALARDETEGLETVRAGAADFRIRPVGPEALLSAVRQLAERLRLHSENTTFRKTILAREGWERIITADPDMRKAIDQARKVAATGSAVLIVGEPGTGKELLARAIHHQSRQAPGPFVALDVGALDEQRLSAELLDEEGRTSAMFRQVRGGSLYLAGIDRMPPVIQGRFHALVGSGRAASIRLLSSSRVNLVERVNEGTFREDLFYRLAEVRLDLPPLRARIRDIRFLAHAFLRRLPAGAAKSFDDRVLRLLEAHDWPDNVRELESIVERASVMSENPVIDVTDLPPLSSRPAERAFGDTDEPVPETAGELKRVKQRLREKAVAGVEQAFLLRALGRSGWNITRAAAAVGMARPNFQTMISKHHLKKPE